MLKLLSQLYQLITSTGLSLPALLVALQKLVAIGFPPPIENEAALRTWFTAVASFLKEAAANTANTTDDTIANFLLKCVNDAGVWSIFYKLLKRLLPTSANLGEFSASPDFVATVLSRSDRDELLAALRDPSVPSNEVNAISPMWILTILQVAKTLYDLLKNRDQD